MEQQGDDRGGSVRRRRPFAETTSIACLVSGPIGAAVPASRVARLTAATTIAKMSPESWMGIQADCDLWQAAAALRKTG